MCVAVCVFVISSGGRISGFHGYIHTSLLFKCQQEMTSRVYAHMYWCKSAYNTILKKIGFFPSGWLDVALARPYRRRGMESCCVVIGWNVFEHVSALEEDILSGFRCKRSTMNGILCNTSLKL